VKLDTAINDPGANLNLTEGWYTVPKDGYYSLDGEIGINIAVGGNYILIVGVLVNGVEQLRGVRWNQSAAGLATLNGVVSGVLKCKAGDHIELCVYHNAPETELVVTEGASVNRLSVMPAGLQGPAGPAGPPGPGGTVERGTTLPATPTDGQEYDYIADATNGVIWRLRYRAASTSTHKWEFVGGSPLQATWPNFGQLTLTANTWTRLGSVQIVCPLAGDYMMGLACSYVVQPVYASGNILLHLGLGNVGGTLNIPLDTIQQAPIIQGGSPYLGGTGWSPSAPPKLIANRAAAEVMALYALTNGGGALWYVENGYMTAVPVRVG